jgi:hypothetical protein
MKQDILGIAEIGEWLGLKRQEIAQWKYLGKLPKPDYELKATPIWKKETLIKWKSENTWISDRINL